MSRLLHASTSSSNFCMNRYSIASKASTTLGVAVGSVIAIPIDHWFTEKQVDPGFSLFAAVILIALGAWVVSVFLDMFFGSSVLLRRLFLGPQFVEGTWIDIVYDEGGQVLSIGETCIEPDGYSIGFHGQNFSIDGKYQDAYHAQMVDLGWPRLRAVGSNAQASGADAAPRSYCEIQFTSASPNPKQYSGTFRMIGASGCYRIHGVKVTSKKDLKALREETSQQEALFRIAKPMIQRVSGHPARVPVPAIGGASGV